MTQPHQIEVDLGQLQLTSQALAADTRDGLKPGLSDTDMKIQQGVPFGAKSPSGEVDAARQALGYTLARNGDNFANHVRRAEQLIGFLDVILKRYRDTDDLAALNADLVTKLYRDALPPVPPPPPTHGLIP